MCKILQILLQVMLSLADSSLTPIILMKKDPFSDLNLKNVDLELKFNNIFDQRQYTRVTYSGLDIHTQLSELRPRNAILTAKFKLL